MKSTRDTNRVKLLGRGAASLAWSLLMALMAGVVVSPALAESTVAGRLAEALVIRSPEAGQALFGEILYEVELDAKLGESATTEPAATLRFVVDGETIAQFDAPPYRAIYDVGQENRDHRFEVLVETADGGSAQRVLESPAIRVDEEIELELQQFYASVTQRNGSLVTDLKREDLVLEDLGKRQEIVTFEGGDAPMTVVVLLDGSSSMGGRPFAEAVQGARSFLGGLRPLDEAKVVVFTDQVLGMSEFLPGGSELPSVLDSVRPLGGSAPIDHLYLAFQLLESRQGRRVILLLSDGADNHSVLDTDQVREVARRSQAMIYWVHPNSRLPGEGAVGYGPTQVPEPRSAWRDRRDSVDQLVGLRKILDISAGREVEIGRSTSVEAAFDEILTELRAQVVVGYYPDPTYDDGRWREVELEVVGRRGVKVRSREGYFDF